MSRTWKPNRMVAMRFQDEVWSEDALLEVLDVDRRTLDRLRRQKNFPCVRLTQRIRVYLAADVLAWLKAQNDGTGAKLPAAEH